MAKAGSHRTVVISGASKGIARTADAMFPGDLHNVDLSSRDVTSSALQKISSDYRIDAVVNGKIRASAAPSVSSPSTESSEQVRAHGNATGLVMLDSDAKGGPHVE